MLDLQNSCPQRPDDIRVQWVLLGQPLGEALLGGLPHCLLLQQALDPHPGFGPRPLQGLQQVGQQVTDSGWLADAAEVVLKLLVEAAILRLTGAAGLLPGQLRYLLVHLLHADPQVPAHMQHTCSTKRRGTLSMAQTHSAIIHPSTLL